MPQAFLFLQGNLQSARPRIVYHKSCQRHEAAGKILFLSVERRKRRCCGRLAALTATIMKYILIGAAGYVLYTGVVAPVLAQREFEQVQQQMQQDFERQRQEQRRQFREDTQEMQRTQEQHAREMMRMQNDLAAQQHQQAHARAQADAQAAMQQAQQAAMPGF